MILPILHNCTLEIEFWDGCIMVRKKGVFVMYEGQNPDVISNGSMENRENDREIKFTEGIFSSQNVQDVYNDSSANSSINSNINGNINTNGNVNINSNANNNISTNGNTNVNSNANGSINTNGIVNTNSNINTNVNVSNAGNTNQVNGYYANNNQDYRYAQGVWQNPNYGQGAGSYQYSNAYPNNYRNVKKEKKKKENNGGGFFRKALVSLSLGLIFGICAGLGLYAVEVITGKTDKNPEQVEEVISQDSVTETLNTDSGKEDEIKDESQESVAASTDETDIVKTQTITTVVSDVSEMVASVMPAVVSINNTYTERISYFGQTFTSEAQASGSGIIVGENDVELLIVTNYHVVEGADKLGVVFTDGSEIEASVKGTDIDMDLAVIAVPLEKILNSTLNQIAVATLGDSDALKVGEPAVAIGNALGYGQSVTTGCISALNREMELEDGSTGIFIQTDAAINPGNSGGALLNVKGEVIGINSNKIGGEVIEGMGYAIPISAASPIIADLMLKETKNKVAKDERGFLGISGISVTEELADDYGMPKGLYITKVYEGTPAEEIGLKKGDIITSFDGEEITSMDELFILLEYYAKGDTVELIVMKAGNNGYRSTKVSVTLGDRAAQ